MTTPNDPRRTPAELLALAESLKKFGESAPATANKYRKKPIVIDAVQWDGTSTGAERVASLVGVYAGSVAFGAMTIRTLEGEMTASPGDWIIKGVKGELYPCKPDVFAATYEPASQPPPSLREALEGAVATAYDNLLAIHGTVLGDIATLRTRLEEAESKIGEAERKLVEVTRERDEARTSNAALEAMLAHQDTELASAAEQISAASSYSELRAERDVLVNQRAALMKTVSSLRAEINKMRNEPTAALAARKGTTT